MLTPEEEKKYFNLLSGYKDVFIWGYKEKLRLDSKVVVCYLSITWVVPLKNSPNSSISVQS